MIATGVTPAVTTCISIQHTSPRSPRRAPFRPGRVPFPVRQEMNTLILSSNQPQKPKKLAINEKNGNVVKFLSF
jgi:hypothetical protein